MVKRSRNLSADELAAQRSMRRMREELRELRLIDW